MLFSSSFLMEMTGMPKSTTQRCMIKSQDAPISRVTGSCDMQVIYRLLEAAQRGLGDYRETVREISLTKGVPDAMLARISGIPQDIMRRPDRGIQFFFEEVDLERGVVASQEQYALHEKYKSKTLTSRYDPRPGDQRNLREALCGTPLADLRATTAPLPDHALSPHHLAIPGLPRLRDAKKLGHDYYARIQEWTYRYQLPAHPIP
jgi:hypothetical protein